MKASALPWITSRTAEDSFFEGEDVCAGQICAGERFARGALADGNRAVWLIEFGRGRDRGICSDQQGQPGREVGIREINGLGAFVGLGHRRNDEINFASLECRDQTDEGNVLDVNRALQVTTERIREVDADSARGPLLIDCLEWRIGKVHADDEFPGAGLTITASFKDQQQKRRRSKSPTADPRKTPDP